MCDFRMIYTRSQVISESDYASLSQIIIIWVHSLSLVENSCMPTYACTEMLTNALTTTAVRRDYDQSTTTYRN